MRISDWSADVCSSDLVIARAANLDMASGWSATVDNYLGRVTKPRILAAVEEDKGAAAASRLSGLKKPEMAQSTEGLLACSGRLPEPLRTPAIEPPAPDDGEQAIDTEAGRKDNAQEAWAVSTEYTSTVS